jgi:hypothetical protein
MVCSPLGHFCTFQRRGEHGEPESIFHELFMNNLFLLDLSEFSSDFSRGRLEFVFGSAAGCTAGCPRCVQAEYTPTAFVGRAFLFTPEESFSSC